MAGIWDSNLKRLVEADPQAFIDWLLHGAIFVLDIEESNNIFAKEYMNALKRVTA